MKDRGLVLKCLQDRINLRPICKVRGVEGYLHLERIWFDYNDIPLFVFSNNLGVYFSEMKPILFHDLLESDCKGSRRFDIVSKNLDIYGLINKGLAENGRGWLYD